MKSFIHNYKTSLLLILSILIGGIAGAVLGPKATVLEPFGQVYLNLMFTLIVPLVFFSVSSSIANMSGMNRLGKILVNIIVIFLIMGIISGALGIIGATIFNPIKGLDADSINKILSLSSEAGDTQKLPLAQQLVNTVTVGDFSGLFSKSNMLQILVFSVLFGVSTALAGEKAAPVKNLLSAGSAVLLKMINVIMYYAPIGLGCYFASVIGQLGTQIIEGYLKVFVLYLGLSVIYYFVFLSIYAYIAGGKQGFKAFWKYTIAPTITALATCSSAASIPVNLTAVKKIGVSNDIADTAIPFGVNTHKDGTVIGGVMKIVFLFGLFGKEFTSAPTLLSILAVSFLVGAVMGAIPGGGMIGEMLILSVYGFSPNLLPVLAVISTIIDAPATVLNTTGNTVGSMVVARFVDGKKWLSKE